MTPLDVTFHPFAQIVLLLMMFLVWLEDVDGRNGSLYENVPVFYFHFMLGVKIISSVQLKLLCNATIDEFLS